MLDRIFHQTKTFILVPIFAVITFSFSQNSAFALNRDELVLKTLNCLEQLKQNDENADLSQECQNIMDSQAEENSDEVYEIANNTKQAETIGNLNDSDEENLKTNENPNEDKYSPAKYTNVEENNVYSERNSDHHLEFGIDMLRFNYEQASHINNRGLETQKTNTGNLAGFHAGYEFVSPENQPATSLLNIFSHPENLNRYKWDFDYHAGKTDYSDISGSPEENFLQHVLEGRITGGYDWMMTPNTRFTPFLGLGYRFMHDSSGDVLDHPSSIIYIPDGQTFTRLQGLRQNYGRNVQNIFIPLGFETSTRLDNNFSLGAKFEYDFIAWGQQKSYFQDIGTVYQEDTGSRTMDLRNITNRLAGGYGIKASARLTKKQTTYDWYLEPFFRYWHLNESTEEQYPLRLSTGTDVILFHSDFTTPYTWLEPENNTTEAGIEIGIVY